MTNSTALRSKVSRSSLEKESLIKTQSEKVEMTLNTDSAIASGLLIQRLTELYEDPIEASVRETVSNGLDAISESFSGETGEIRITSPSTLNPVFSVQDNGVGMSYNDLKDIYSKYGASTKMNNFEQIGAYGLGAKAPLAYGTEFTVSSVKEGVRTTIIVAREELTNYIQIVDSVETDDLSGTTVSIPVSNYDIPRFESQIENYRKNPIDKNNVKIFINEEEILSNDFFQITDKMVIFNEDGEQVEARLWVNKDQSTIVNLISSMGKSEVVKTLQYLIGGWSYSSPARRGSYYKNTPGLMVELKAGIVGFNSSRDAIMENERYSKLEDLVIEYVKSNEFMKDLIKTINTIDLPNFKEIVVTLLKRNETNIKMKDGKIKIETLGGVQRYGSSGVFARSYSISDFVHEETGFRFDNILKAIPKGEQTVASIENLVTYKKTPISSLLTSYGNSDEEVSNGRFSTSRVSDINAEIEAVMYGEKDSHSLESLMMNLALSAYTKTSSKMNVTFITDVEADVDEKGTTTDFSRLRSGRKTIITMRNEGKNEASYDSYLVYTSASKTSIDKMLKEAKFDDFDILVESAEKMAEKVKEYRKNNRSKPQAKSKDLTTLIQKYDVDKDTLDRVLADTIEVEEDKVNLILLSKEGYINTTDLKMIHAWYCNTNNIKKENLNLYSSLGMHRIVDMEFLSELGDLYENPRSRYAGTSKYYNELLAGKVAKMNSINEGSEDLEKKAFIRVLSSLIGAMPSSVSDKIEYSLKEANKFALAAGLEEVEIPSEVIREIGDFGSKEFGTSYSGRHWELDNSATTHLLTLIDKEKYGLIESLVSLMSTSSVSIEETGEFKKNYYSNSSLSVDKDLIELAAKEENKDKAYHKMLLGQVKVHMEFITSTAKDLAAIKL